MKALQTLSLGSLLLTGDGAMHWEGNWKIEPIQWEGGEVKISSQAIAKDIVFYGGATRLENSVCSAESSELETIFNGLSHKWKNETRGQSSISRMVMHPSYLAIIGLGKEALPFILKDLQRETNHWFTALRAISKVESSPVRSEDAGNLKKMREAWLKWGKDNGYLG